MKDVVIPPPGRRLSFREWTEIIVERVRAEVRDAIAMSSCGGRRVSIRYKGQSAVILDDAGVWWTYTYRDGGQRAMPPLYDQQRHDWFTAENEARTLIGFFDSEKSRPISR